MKRISLAALLLMLVLGAGCGTKEDKEVDTPAGHPDELRDSTRLDPAVDSTKPVDSTNATGGEAARPKKKYRFSS